MARRATKSDEESPLVGRTPTSALDPQVQPLPSQGARLRVRGPAPPTAFFNRVVAAGARCRSFTLPYITGTAQKAHEPSNFCVVRLIQTRMNQPRRYKAQ